MNGSDLEALARDVRYLKDRQEILDCVHKHARGHDRFDVALMTECYHDDGIDEHGSFAVHTGPEYGEWSNKTHKAGSQMCLHNITSHTCEINGDEAHAESYVIGTMLNKDGVTCRFLNGRYVDRLERRDGVWRIALRRCTVDVVLKGDSSIMQTDLFKHYGMIKGTRDATDLSYDRPLTLEREVDRW
jgi:SnoaL-like domain